MLRIRNKRILAIVLVATSAAAVLALPRSAQSRAARAVADLSVTKTAPTTVAPGEQFDYTIMLSYTGTTQTGDVTVTDPLPAGIRFIAMSSIMNATCPTQPAPGSNGTVSCTTQLGPQTAGSTIVIHVEAAPDAPGSVTNTVQVSTGASASATTAVAEPPPPPPGSFTVTKTGPATVLMHEGQRGDKFPYTITIKYTGPSRTSPISTRFIDRMPVALTGVSYANADGVSLSDCSSENGPTQPDGAPGALTNTCAIAIDPTRTTSFQIVSGAYATRPGVQTNVFELANGDAASWTTDFVLIAAPPPPPPPPPAPPPPLPGPPAAPTQTVTETFTSAGQAEPEAVAIAPSTETVQVALTWSDPNSSFDVVDIKLVTGGRKLASAEKLKPGKLKITKIRKKRSLDVRIKNLERGKLKFKIVAKKLGTKATKVKAKIRQSKR